MSKVLMKGNEAMALAAIKAGCEAFYGYPITPQNEPLHPGNDPSMLMLAEQQSEFIKNHLGPAFKASQLNTKIVIYDHNCNKPEYPIAILNDVAASRFIDGSAFH